MKKLIRELGDCITLYRDTNNGIAWIEDGSTGCGYSCHSNIDITGSVRGMKNLGYWKKDARTIRSHGWIYNIEDFADNDKALLIQEIERKYYSPTIKEIHGLKERYGFSYWKVTVEDGREINFTMQDTFKNIIRIGDDRAMLIDVDGNRYTIKSITDLDRKSYRKIELYL